MTSTTSTAPPHTDLSANANGVIGPFAETARHQSASGWERKPRFAACQKKARLASTVIMKEQEGDFAGGQLTENSHLRCWFSP
jgi:hypothetical protein